MRGDEDHFLDPGRKVCRDDGAVAAMDLGGYRGPIQEGEVNPFSGWHVQFAGAGRQSRSFLIKGNPSAPGSMELSGLAAGPQRRGQAVNSLDRPADDLALSEIAGEYSRCVWPNGRVEDDGHASLLLQSAYACIGSGIW